MSPIWTFQFDDAPRRHKCASAAVGHIVYSFGGDTGTNAITPLIVVHSLDTNTLEWSLVPYTYDSVDDVPFDRWSHTVIADGHKIYLWGGKNDGNVCNVLFAFNSQTLKWSRPNVSEVTPVARYGHAATVCGRKMYIFGGYNRVVVPEQEEQREQYSHDLYSLDLDTFTWYRIVTGGMPPDSNSRDYSLSCIDETLYVFGGKHRLEENEIVCLDLGSLTWSRPVTKNAPIGRRSHSVFVFNKCLYIFGGSTHTEHRCRNDLHMYNPETREWREVSTQGPPPRRRTLACCIVVKSELFLFGGTRDVDILTDYSVLDFLPSLATLVKVFIIERDLPTRYPGYLDVLPARMQKEIRDLAGKIMGARLV